LWNPEGIMLADLTGRAKMRRLIQSRNEADDIYWQVGMVEIEQLARALHMHPNELLVTNQTEIRIRRGDEYIGGGQLIYRYPRVTTQTADFELRASGFLNLMSDRYTDDERIFTATEATTITSTLITESQALTNGDFGITIGSLATVGVHDITYKAENIKDVIQANAAQFNFDFEFTHDKVFNTYAALGSVRPEIIFEYPGNIREFGAPEDGTRLANHVTALGSGSGTQGNIRAVSEDADSQLDYKLRQDRINVSGVEDEADLQRHADVHRDTWSRPFEVPDLTVDGNIAPFVTDYRIGDYVTVQCKQFRSLEHINGLYRIEKRQIEIDENDNETVKLYVSK
jgi:hypothetical protein